MTARAAPPDREGRRFPLAVAVLCGGAALALFVSGTVPAIAERGQLRDLEAGRRALLELLQRESADLAATERALARDPQAVLVELDRLGYTPGDLLDPAAGSGNVDSDRSSR